MLSIALSRGAAGAPRSPGALIRKPHRRINPIGSPQEGGSCSGNGPNSPTRRETPAPLGKSGGFLEPGVFKEWEVIGTGRVSFQDDGNFRQSGWQWMHNSLVKQQKTPHCIVRCKWVRSMACELCLNEAVTKKKKKKIPPLYLLPKHSLPPANQRRPQSH